MPENDDDTFRVAPEAQAQLDKLIRDDPEFAAEFREFSANMRQAMHAWQTGRYPSFEDAMEAITGQRPRRIDLDDDAMEALDEIEKDNNVE